MDICIDFDGTCVMNEFPEIGPDVPHAVEVLIDLVKNGHNLILFTMRGDRIEHGEPGDDTILDVTGPFLSDAVKWFKSKGLPLFGIQSNPSQANWTTSPKAYGQIYIDDSAIGCPLIFPQVRNVKPYVDWLAVRRILVEMRILQTGYQTTVMVPKNPGRERNFEETMKGYSDHLYKSMFPNKNNSNV